MDYENILNRSLNKRDSAIEISPQKPYKQKSNCNRQGSNDKCRVITELKNSKYINLKIMNKRRHNFSVTTSDSFNLTTDCDINGEEKFSKTNKQEQEVNKEGCSNSLQIISQIQENNCLDYKNASKILEKNITENQEFLDNSLKANEYFKDENNVYNLKSGIDQPNGDSECNLKDFLENSNQKSYFLKSIISNLNILKLCDLICKCDLLLKESKESQELKVKSNTSPDSNHYIQIIENVAKEKQSEVQNLLNTQNQSDINKNVFDYPCVLDDTKEEISNYHISNSD